MRAFNCALLVITLGAGLTRAHADDIPWGLNPNLNDTIFIGLGAFYTAKSSTTAQLNSQTLGVGTVVDFQNTLGMSGTGWGPDAEFRWRMSERWRLELSYFWVGQSASRSIDQDIQWGDVVYPVNAQVGSKLGFSDLRTSVGYSFYKTSDKELGVGVGAALAVVAGKSQQFDPGHRGRQLACPTARHQHLWRVRARRAVVGRRAPRRVLVDVPAVPRRHHGPRAQSAVPAVPAQGFGLGYTALFLNFQADSTGLGSFQGKLNQNIQGPSFYVTASF